MAKANGEVSAPDAVARRPDQTLQRKKRDLQHNRKRELEARRQYGRGEGAPFEHSKDKKLKANLRALEKKYKDASLQAKDAEILNSNTPGLIEAEGELDKTYRVRQTDIRNAVPLQTAKKSFELKLTELGPYIAEYTRNGRDLLLAGRRGHIATMDWRSGKLGCEIQLHDHINDAKWLHNHLSFAVAQRDNVYIYDSAGVEIHKLDKYRHVTHMDFLPYHFLLASINDGGVLKYLDTSIGKTVTESSTNQGPATAFRQNPYNAIMHVGHHRGTVSLWSPNSSSYMAKLKVHQGPVTGIAMDRSGNYMTTVGQDAKMTVWDIRQFKEVHQYRLARPGCDISISDRNLVSVAYGTHVSVWQGLFDKNLGDVLQKVQRPYVTWGGEGQRVERVRWCPLEDVLGVSHHEGFSSIIVPGAGEANFDSLEINPYENKKQRQEGEVRGLLNKLQPETISLEPNFIGNLDRASAETRKREKDLDKEVEDPVMQLKNRGKGRNSSLRKYLRKKGTKNIIDEKRLRIQERMKRENERKQVGREKKQADLGPALSRFAR